MKDRLSSIIPKYARLPLLTVVIVNILVYFFSRLINVNLEHHFLGTFIDDAIPFLPEFIIIYVLAYLQWIVCYIIISRESRKRCYYYMTAEIVAKILCFFFYIFYPTAILRPEIAGGGFFNNFTGLIYSLDIPNNLFPSVHCLASYMCFRGAITLKNVGKGYKTATLIFSLLVFASTVFVKQHFFIDIFGGIIAVEIGILLTRLLKLDKIFPKLNRLASKLRGGNYYE